MRKLVSGFAVVLMSAGLAACGSSNAPANNIAAVDETVLNDELPADENLSITDNGLIGNGLEADPLGNEAVTTNAL
jgi:hypothetical protein